MKCDEKIKRIKEIPRATTEPPTFSIHQRGTLNNIQKIFEVKGWSL